MSAPAPFLGREIGIAVGVAALAVVIAVVLSTTAALIPAIQAGRISVTDALRRIG